MKKIILAAFLSSAMVPAAFAQATTTPEAAPTTPMQSGTAPMDSTSDTAATGTTEMAAPAGETAMATPSTDGPFVTVAENGIQRVSDIQGEDVYSQSGEDIGEVNDVLIGPDGQVAAVVVGVGGFLGIGEKNVAVSMDALKLPTMVDTASTASTTAEPTTTTGMATTGTGTTGMATTGTATTGTATTGTAAAPGATTTVTDPQMAANENMESRIVLDVTREQLEQAPAYEGTAAQVAQ